MSVTALKTRLREDLKAAMQARAADEVRLLRMLAAAVDNAEAVPAEGLHDRANPSAFGLGAGEALRRELTADDLAALLDRERDERLAAASEYERLGQTAEAARLMREAELIARYTP
jgi:uncharacterized protein YqeY